MYKSKQCPICGNEFVPKSARQKYCNAPVMRSCAVCGKQYESTCSLTYSKCCSKECSKEYAHQQSVASYQGLRKVCVLCGKEFTPKNNTQAICSDTHFKNCSVCGKPFQIRWHSGMNISSIPKTCSPQCKTQASFANGNPFTNPESREKAKQTMLRKYGVEHAAQSESIKQKMRDTTMARYGAEHFTQTPEYIEKAKATNRSKYGSDWAMQNPDCQQKAKDTLYVNYGVTNPMESDELKNKISKTYKGRTGYDYPAQNPEAVKKTKQTNLARYGFEYAQQNPDIRDKIIQTNLDRWGGIGAGSPEIAERIKATSRDKYGHDNPASSPEVQAKIADTMFKRYGVSHYNESWEYRKSAMTDPTKLDEWKSFLDDPEAYIKTHFDHKPNYRELADALGVNDSTIQFHLSQMGKSDLVQFTLSYAENDIVDILKEIDPTIQIVRHDRSMIAPYELDIYLPDHKLAIEINPTLTHNSSFGAYNNDPKAPSYHKLKTNMCEQQGIFLFHIFGYEWSHKKEIIISMLRNLLGRNTDRIYARNCEVREVPGKEAYEFLMRNHRQGGVHSKYRYGLYYHGELVSLMTFGMMRNTLGIGGEDLSDCWELVRYCNKLNTSVVGAASKLFKYFLKRYSPARVRSFSDRAHTKGGLYQTLGFVEVSRSTENYVWVCLKTNQAYNRVNAQKHNLRKFFHDDTIDLTQTEAQIMESRGYAKVYDSGTITWQWSAK